MRVLHERRGNIDASILKYRAFLKTVELGSFTRAAEALCYSQSGVSRMVADLEREWRVSLLERGRFGVRLTSDGTKLLPYAAGLCAEYDKLQMQVNALHGLQWGIIRIGTFSSVATHWLPNIIKEFQKDYPGIEYELLLGDYTEIEHWIAEGRVDCGFLRLPTCPDFTTIPLQQDELLAVLPQGHRLAGQEAVRVQDLCAEPFLLLEKGAKAEISELFEAQGLIPDVRFTTWDDYAVMSMVESGLGLSILPKLILRRVPYEIILRSLAPQAFRTIGIAVREERTTSLAVKRFLEYLPFRDVKK